MPWRDWQLAIAGVLAMFVLAVGVMLLRGSGPNDAARLEQPVVQAAQVRAAATLATVAAKANARTAERDAGAAVSRAAAARARARVTSSGEVMIAATPNAEPTLVQVPAPVVERMRLDSSAVASLGVLVQWKDTVIVTQDRRIAADSLELIASANAFHALARAKQPWCGRRCGIVLGVGGMLAGAVAITQVRKAFR